MQKDIKKATAPETDKKVGISRKQAIKKASLIGLSAASMMLLVKTANAAQASAPATPPTW